MKDRVPGAPGRYSAVVTTENLQALQTGQPFTITLVRDDDPIEPGTPYSKAAVLPDSAAEAICPDVENPTPADAFIALHTKKAPAGYGLGENSGRYCSDCNTACSPGFYCILDSTCKNTPAGYNLWKWAVLLVQRRGYDVFQTIMFNGVSATRMISLDGNTGAVKSSGNWMYITPPLNPSTEYLTTEKFNGSPVYAKLLDFGSVSNNSKNMYIADYVGDVVRIDGYWYQKTSKLTKQPFTSANFVTFTSVSQVTGNGKNTWNLVVATDNDGADYYGLPVVYYTKRTV